MENKFSHLDKDGQPRMVDVSDKEITTRRAVARGVIRVGTAIMGELEAGDFKTKKGSVIQTAIIAGNMAVKQTANIIPLCHPLTITGCDINVKKLDAERLEAVCTVKTSGKTGVEMEALNGVSAVLLTIYDMVKAMSHDILIEQIMLMEKTGGKSDYAR